MGCLRQEGGEDQGGHLTGPWSYDEGSPQHPTLVLETTAPQGSGAWQGHLEAEGQIANVPVTQQEATRWTSELW